MGLNKAAKFYYYPGWWEAGPTLHLLVNLKAWNNLPSEYQNILQTAAVEANRECLAKYDARNPPALQRLLQQGTQLREFSPEILKAAEKMSFELFQENAAKSLSFKSVYQSWKQFRDSIYLWHSVSELGYSQFLIPDSVK